MVYLILSSSLKLSSSNNRLDNLEYVTKVENAQAYRDSDKFKEYMKRVAS